jgi:hypothetical protein
MRNEKPSQIVLVNLSPHSSDPPRAKNTSEPWNQGRAGTTDLNIGLTAFSTRTERSERSCRRRRRIRKTNVMELVGH